MLIGEFSGLLLSATSDSPLYLVVQRSGSAGERRLIPIGSAWLDQTARVIRVDDADVQSATAFDLSRSRATGRPFSARDRGQEPRLNACPHPTCSGHSPG